MANLPPTPPPTPARVRFATVSLVSDMDTKPEHNRSEQARLRAKETRTRTGFEIEAATLAASS